MFARHAAALLALAVVGCETLSPVTETPRRFVATGAYDVRYWADPSVPGSLATSEGTRMPMYFVCDIADDASARAAAVLTDATLTLFGDGTALLNLGVGTWLQRGGLVASSGETLSRYGTWTESEAGRVTISGFNLPGFGGTLTYTDLGHAEMSMTLSCPGGSAMPTLTPTVTLTRLP